MRKRALTVFLTVFLMPPEKKTVNDEERWRSFGALTVKRPSTVLGVDGLFEWGTRQKLFTAANTGGSNTSRGGETEKWQKWKTVKSVRIHQKREKKERWRSFRKDRQQDRQRSFAHTLYYDVTTARIRYSYYRYRYSIRRTYRYMMYSILYIPNTPFGAPGGPKTKKTNIILKNLSITSLHSTKKINWIDRNLKLDYIYNLIQSWWKLMHIW